MIRAALLVCLIFGLGGCPLYQLNENSDSQPLGQPVLFNHPGLLRLEATGLEFSEWYANFQRVAAYRYDTRGRDVSVGYNDRRQDCLVVATFYLYPTPPMSFIGASPEAVSSVEQNWLDRGFAEAKAEVERYHPRLESPVVSVSTTPAGGTDLRGLSFMFHEGGDVSELHLFVYRHQWFLKFRFTYPDSCRAEARAKLKALVSNLPWANSG